MDGSELLLWDQWRQQRDAVARDALVLKYSPWARMLARDIYMRVYRMRDAWQDCAQNALIGLLEAMERFDPRLGAGFPTFARRRVRGAVFDGLRALSDHSQLDSARLDLERAVTERLESLHEGGANTADSFEMFVSTTIGLGLGFLMDAQSMPVEEHVPDVYTALEKENLEAAVTYCVGRLDERERTILTLHYYHHMPFVDIADQLHLTKGRISQLHKRALESLRSLLWQSSSFGY